MYTVAITSLVMLALLIAPTLTPSFSKLYLVQRISFVQCDQTCTVVAEGLVEKELAFVEPRVNNQSGNPFIGDGHVYNTTG